MLTSCKIVLDESFDAVFLSGQYTDAVGMSGYTAEDCIGRSTQVCLKGLRVLDFCLWGYSNLSIHCRFE